MSTRTTQLQKKEFLAIWDLIGGVPELPPDRASIKATIRELY
jgi:hypothetical protein